MTTAPGIRAGLAAIAVTLAAGVPAGSAFADHPLEPDLAPEPASDLSLQFNGSTRTGLRLTTTIRNAGAGPLEVYPVGGIDCDGDGDMGNDRLAYQRVFEDGDEDGAFDPAVDTTSDSDEAGCMIYHPAHDHWHFENFSDFQLLTPGGVVIATTDKVSFCLSDTSPFDLGLPGAPAMGHYAFTSCQADATEGISVGWRDIYESSLPGQRIDIEGVPHGAYCVAVTSDPDNLLRESDDSNNTSLHGILLSGDRIIDSPEGCAAPVQRIGTAAPPATAGPTGERAAAFKKCRKKSKKAKKKCNQRARKLPV